MPEATEQVDWGCDFSTLMKTPSSSTASSVGLDSQGTSRLRPRKQKVQKAAQIVNPNGDNIDDKEDWVPAAVSGPQSAKNYNTHCKMSFNFYSDFSIRFLKCVSRFWSESDLILLISHFFDTSGIFRYFGFF